MYGSRPTLRRGNTNKAELKLIRNLSDGLLTEDRRCIKLEVLGHDIEKEGKVKEKHLFQ